MRPGLLQQRVGGGEEFGVLGGEFTRLRHDSAQVLGHHRQ
ncbi:Uncharacterised protein [Mycobacteroides abscessus subsp. massiliense]|nr:Uncharacterised protein [Mycobacteroides abscessus subsp. massiliense]